MAHSMKEHGWSLTPMEVNAPGGSHLVREDDYDYGATISSQYPPRSVREQPSKAVFVEHAIPGRRPQPQFSRMTEETFTFKASFIGDPSRGMARGVDETEKRSEALTMRRLLKKATHRLVSLRRPQRYFFTWGAIAFHCYVLNVGSIEYGDTHRFGDQILQHVIGFNVELRVLETEDVVVVPSSHPPDVPDYVWKKGDTYESVSQRYYGDPVHGATLRQHNDKAFPQTGTTIKLLDAHVLKLTGASPVALALSASRGDVSNVLNDIATSRLRFNPPGSFAKTGADVVGL